MCLLSLVKLVTAGNVSWSFLFLSPFKQSQWQDGPRRTMCSLITVIFLDVWTYLGTLAKYVMSRLRSSLSSRSGCVREGKVRIGPPRLSRPPEEINSLVNLYLIQDQSQVWTSIAAHHSSPFNYHKLKKTLYTTYMYIVCRYTIFNYSKTWLNRTPMGLTNLFSLDRY